MTVDTHNERRFYGRRRGHTLSNRQKVALEKGLHCFGISDSDLGHFPHFLKSQFTASLQNLWLEIGFGKGEHLAWQASQNPDVSFLGCEPFVNGVAGLVDTLLDNDIKNVRIYPDDARNLIDALPDGSLDRVFLLHPDPWPKKRHVSRRFVNPDNLNSLAKKMKRGALLRISTDHPNYARWVILQMHNREDFRWGAEEKSDWLERPDDWPETRYAHKAIHPCVFFEFEKV